jgi:hypothetical protein
MRLTMRLPGSLLSALLLCGGGLLAAAPARAGGIDLICALPSSRNGGLGTLVDFSLQEGSGSGSSFWPANGQRQAVLSRASSSEIQILQPGSGTLLFSIERLNGGITTPGGERGRCTNAGTVRVERAI